MMSESKNYHADYPDIKRYWSDTSQRYAGGDHLLTALQRGWVMGDVVYEQRVWHGGSRLVIIYHIDLTRESETMIMPVVTTPFIRRMIRRMGCKIMPLEERRESQEQRYLGDK